MRKVLSWSWANRHMISAWVWIGLLPLALTIWRDSILFVIIISVYNNIKTDISTHNSQKAKENSAEDKP